MASGYITPCALGRMIGAVGGRHGEDGILLAIKIAQIENPSIKLGLCDMSIPSWAPNPEGASAIALGREALAQLKLLLEEIERLLRRLVRSRTWRWLLKRLFVAVMLQKALQKLVTEGMQYVEALETLLEEMQRLHDRMCGHTEACGHPIPDVPRET